jgi:hypothetical protein
MRSVDQSLANLLFARHQPFAGRVSLLKLLGEGRTQTGKRGII